MGYYYVYGPVNNETIEGLGTYCGTQIVHSTCRYSTPVDIDTLADTNIYFRGSDYIGSIRFVLGWYCCCGDVGDDYARTVEVELYDDPNTTCYIGTVLYGHLENLNSSIFSGKTQVYNGESIFIGESMQGVHAPCDFDDDPENDECYDGAHIHLEEHSGEYIGPSCGGSVYDSTPIYRYYFNAGSCP